MNVVRLLVLALLLLPSLALAQTGVLSGGSVTATGTTASRTLADRFAQLVNVKDFGATGGALGFSDAAMANGTNVLTSASSSFSAADVGKDINVGYTPWASFLSGTITGVTDAHTITTSFTAPASVSSGIGAYGQDDSSSIAAAINYANTQIAKGVRVVVYFPGGSYYIENTPVPMFTFGGSVLGDGKEKSTIVVDPNYSGDVFSWNEAWANSQWNGPGFSPASDRAGPTIRNIAVSGNAAASNQQNAFMFYGRDDFVLMENVLVVSLHGRGIGVGFLTGSDTEAYMRESHFYNTYFYTVGSSGVPVVEITANGSTQGSNQLTWYDLNILGNIDAGLVIRNKVSGFPITQLRFFGARIEGSLGPNPPATSGDLVQIGDSSATYAGKVNDISFFGLTLTSSASGHAAFTMNANSSTQEPYGITAFMHNVSGAGVGLNIQSGRASEFHVGDMSTTGTQVVVGPSTLVGANLLFDGYGLQNTWTYSIDSTSQNLVQSLATYTAGGSNNVSAPNSMAFGLSNTPGSSGFCTGFSCAGMTTDEQAFGVSVYGRTWYAAGCRNAAFFSAGNRGDMQVCEQTLGGSTVGAVTSTLTADLNAASTNNILNLNLGTGATKMTQSCSGIITVIDSTTPSKMGSWDVKFGALRQSSGSTVVSIPWNSVTFLGGDATLQSDVSFAIGHDDTHAGVLIQPTVVTLTDTLHYSAPMRCTQVQ